MTEYFNITCRGARHKSERTTCQDYSSALSKKNISIAIVADGHGGRPYFRSNTGSKFAVEAAKSCLKQFEKTLDKSIFKDKKKLCFASYEELSKEERESKEYQILQELFHSIHELWKQKINNDIAKHPFTDKELARVPEEYRTRLGKKAESFWPYGTTLIACLQTDEYWMMLQIGDGLAVTLDGKKWNQPIPKDKKCHDNITTSLCDRYAAEGFRVYFESGEHRPDAIFLCTDGMEKVFASMDKHVAYYHAMIDVLREAGKDTLIETMKQILPDFSLLSSGDDISIACICNNFDLPFLD